MRLRMDEKTTLCNTPGSYPHRIGASLTDPPRPWGEGRPPVAVVAQQAARARTASREARLRRRSSCPATDCRTPATTAERSSVPVSCEGGQIAR